MDIHTDWVQLQHQIDEAPWSQRGNVVQRYAERFGCSAATIYRKLRKRYGAKRTLERPVKVDPGNEMIKIIFKMKTMGEMMHLQKREVATEWCIKELIRQGYEQAKHLSVSTVNRRLNEAGFRERQPSKRLEAGYANQVHMIDFSRSKYFQLFEYDAQKDDYMLVVSGKSLFYKQENARLRTWLVQYMDDYSRLRKVKMYAATNESAFLGLDHLQYCYRQSEHPMHYLPLEMLRSDNGSFRKSKETMAAMEALDVTLTKQRPGHKGGTAKIENRFRSLWQQFEIRQAIRYGDGGRLWLSEYNDLLEEFCINEQQAAHPFEKGITKGERYERSLADRSITQRTTDADLVRLACRVEQRKVDGHLRISLDSTYYEVPQYVDGVPTIGKRVYVHKNMAGELTGKLIDDLATSSFALEKWAPARWGEEQFESFQRSPKRQLEDAFEEQMPSYQEIVGGKDSRKAAETQSSSNITYMKPETEHVAPDSPFNEQIKQAGRIFQTELNAREYIGIRVEAWGLSWGDVAGYFDFDQMPVAQRELDRIIEQVGADFDSGKIARSA